MSRRAALAVVGLGRIGRLHAENLAGRIPAAELVAVCDPVEPLARSVGRAHGVEWSVSFDDLVADPDLDGVVIAAPTAEHVTLVHGATAAGRHVLCEKPLGFDAEAAAAATTSARAAGVVLQVGFQRRFDPDWVAVKAMLDHRELGELALLRCTHRNPREPDSGAALGDLFADVAIHDLDAARWLAGEVSELYALTGDGATTLALRFAGGALGLIDVSRRAAYGFDCTLELMGSEATVRVGYGARRDRVELLREGHASGALPRDHAERHEAAYVAELAGFADAVLGAPASGPGGEDAVAALELVDRARRSAELGVPVTIEPAALDPVR